MRERGTAAVDWASRWGFAVLVGFGAVAAIWVTCAVDPPAEIPSFALQAAVVYRLEVGAAVFAAAYLASLAFVLALGNRGFSELSATGVRAHDLGTSAVDQAVEDHDEILGGLVESVRELREESGFETRREKE